MCVFCYSQPKTSSAGGEYGFGENQTGISVDLEFFEMFGIGGQSFNTNTCTHAGIVRDSILFITS